MSTAPESLLGCSIIPGQYVDRNDGNHSFALVEQADIGMILGPAVPMRKGDIVIVKDFVILDNIRSSLYQDAPVVVELLTGIHGEGNLRIFSQIADFLPGDPR